MVYWNRYDEQEDEQDHDFESGSRYHRGGLSRHRDRPQQSRRDSWRDSVHERNQDRNQYNLSNDYSELGERYGQTYRTWGNEDRDWDYDYALDNGQNRDVRRDYQSDREAYDQRRNLRDQDRHNASRYNQNEEYNGIGFRPTNYNPRHPGYMPDREIPVAGMQSDFGAGFEYDDNRDSGRSNNGRCDVGYDSEGAFYQDMDDPENSAMRPFRQAIGLQSASTLAKARQTTAAPTAASRRMYVSAWPCMGGSMRVI